MQPETDTPRRGWASVCARARFRATLCCVSNTQSGSWDKNTCYHVLYPITRADTRFSFPRSSYLDHNFEEVVTLEHVAYLFAVGVLAHQLDEGSLGGLVAPVQAYPYDSQPLVRLDHLLLRLSTCAHRDPHRKGLHVPGRINY